MVKKIHHINFLVRKLEPAVERYRRLLGADKVIHENLPGRGVKTARFKVGDTWIVLVEPVDPDGVPARRLAEQGEGFFLISYAVDDLDKAVELAGQAGVKSVDAEPRTGLSGWRVTDLDSTDLFGVETQLAKEKG